MYRYSPHTPEENNICPASFPSQTNRFDFKSSSCQCNFNSRSKKIQLSSSVCHNAEIPKETCVHFELKKTDKQGDKIFRDSVIKKQKLNQDNAGEKKSSTVDLCQSETGNEILIEKKITTGAENKGKTFKDQESGTENLLETNFNSKELVENNRRRTNMSSTVNKDENNLKDAGIQTNSDSKNCCDNLREEILRMFENFREQPRVLQATNSLLSRGFLSNSQSLGPDVNNRSFLNSDSGNSPQKINDPKVNTPEKSTYKNGPPISLNSPGNFVQQMEERKDCLCCGSEVISRSTENSMKSKDVRNLNEEEEQKKVTEQFDENSHDFHMVDATRPDFVKVLMEIGEYTRNLERQLAQMNETMRSRVNETNAWSSGNVNTKPVGSSTPKELKNDEQTFVSLSDYVGSDIPIFNSVESVTENELVTRKIEDDIQKNYQDSEIVFSSPIGASTPVSQKQKEQRKSDGKVSNLRISALKKSTPLIPSPSNQTPGPSHGTQSLNLENNASASNPSENLRLSFNKKTYKNKQVQNEDNILDETQYKELPE